MPRHAYRRDHAHAHTEYVTVKATLANPTDAALLLVSDKFTTPVWVPRYALSPMSRALTFRSLRGDSVEIEVELKMALEKGIA